MRKWVIALVVLLVGVAVKVGLRTQAAPPGGGGSVRYSVYADVALPDGSPAVGVEVRMVVETMYYTGSGWVTYTCGKSGLTDALGHVNLYCDVPEEYADEMNYLKAFVSDSNYTTLEAVNDITYSYAVLYPEFTVVYDADGDSLDDNVEAQIAEKFKPVLHRHSYDSQEGLASADLILQNSATLKAWNTLGEEVYNSDIPPTHVWELWYRDSFRRRSV
jgi:hypothetical protein